MRSIDLSSRSQGARASSECKERQALLTFWDINKLKFNLKIFNRRAAADSQRHSLPPLQSYQR